ncbi:hypothetical protein [Thiorhodovibrio winogradskyi]|uniref:hypothetical protein n=1 Tax=Thiorhodovibrio winogradskyi TaxID=77007 RepID=UPI002E29DDAA|nr:hypothetical protein [Thiorhodovibrio winogradskyi]
MLIQAHIARLTKVADRQPLIQVSEYPTVSAVLCATLQEPVETRPVIDILNLLERNNYLPSTRRWQEIREIRHQISHEYCLSTAELIVTLQVAFTMVTEMADVVSALKSKAQPS